MAGQMKRFRKALQQKGKFMVTAHFHGNPKPIKKRFTTQKARDNYITGIKNRGNYESHSSW